MIKPLLVLLCPFQVFKIQQLHLNGKLVMDVSVLNNHFKLGRMQKSIASKEEATWHLSLQMEPTISCQKNLIPLTHKKVFGLELNMGALMGALMKGEWTWTDGSLFDFETWLSQPPSSMHLRVCIY